jgi:hypothetical protein
MKTCISLGFILLLAMPVHAETYSWIDDSGTYNYTEEYSSVPEKYRKKVKRRGDLQQDVKPQEPVIPESSPRQAEKSDAKPAAVPGDEKDLYGGKSHAAWRTEMAALETELKAIEQHMEQVRRQILDPKGVSKEQVGVLKKDYDDSRATYDKKYKSYTELIETIRKAGIAVEIKK